MTAEEIHKWTDWFIATNDLESMKSWRAALITFPDDLAMLRGWATIIELNRLDRIEKPIMVTVP